MFEMENVIGENIACVRLNDDNKTANGVVRGSYNKEKSLIVRVIDVGAHISYAVKKGDILLIQKFSGTEATIGDKNILFVRPMDVLAKLTKEKKWVMN